MADMLKTLLEERGRLKQQMETVEAAIKIYGGSVDSGKGSTKGVKRGPMPEAQRAKLALAQKKRWAEVRKKEGKKSKKPAPATKAAE